MTLRLAVVATHPVQYVVPVLQGLARRGRVVPHVFYGLPGGAGATGALDHGFGQVVRWDVPLLEGYEHAFVANRAADPGSHHFGGVDCPELVPAILAARPDAVLVVGWAYRSHLAAMRALHGRIPLLFRGDSTLIGERPGARRAMRRIWLRWVYRHVDRALYVGTRNRQYFEAHGVRGERLAYVPQGVDDGRFREPRAELRAEADRWRARLGLDPGVPTFLFAGKLEPKKRPDVLLRAYASLELPAQLVLAGSGPLEGALKAQAADLTGVRFVGFQNQLAMPVVYRLGDVLVLPSGAGETWGLAVNEAMSCGLPIVVSDMVGCAPDLVEEGKNGRVVPAGDVPALARAMASIAADAGARAAMAAASLRKIDAWSLDRQVLALEEAVEELVAARRRAAAS